MPKAVTTHKQYLYYQERVKHWLDYFKLYDMEVQFKHGKTKGHAARTIFNTKFRWVKFYFPIKISDFYQDMEQINITAFHEVVEGVLLANLIMLSVNKDADDYEIEKESHRIVNLMTQAIVKEPVDAEVV